MLKPRVYVWLFEGLFDQTQSGSILLSGYPLTHIYVHCITKVTLTTGGY